MRKTAASVLAGLGALTAALGTASLITLASTYRSGDLAVTETPQTFLAWLVEQHAMSAEAAPADLSWRIARRLDVMPLDKRRDLTVALLAPESWQALTTPGASPRAAQVKVRDGLLLALERNPAAGDLYLAAAALETRLDGFTDRSLALLRSSRIFAPRELPVLRARLAFAATVWTLLDEEDRQAMRADFAVLRSTEPKIADQMLKALANSGVGLE